MTQMRWQDWATLVVGIWMVISPWALGYHAETVAMANALIVGIAIGVCSMIELSAPRPWEEWLMLAAGIWLVISPWVLRFSHHAAAAWDSALAGAAVVILTLWALSQLRAAQPGGGQNPA